MKILTTLILIILLNAANASTMPTAPVSGFARSFLLQTPIANASITVLETGQNLITDQQGHFGPIQYPIGQTITLAFKKFGYKATQSATIQVPPEGLNTPYTHITFQIPSLITYYLFVAIIGASLDTNSCHVVATVTKHHKTLDDEPQGEPDATVTLYPSVAQKPFYFNIFKNRLLKNKTNPFTKGLTTTSLDGGIAFFNVPPRSKPYVLIAQKPNTTFSRSQFLCRAGEFINISPPQGPSVNVNTI